MIKLFVYDLDGTLIDSAQDLAESTNHLIAERGGVPLDQARIVRMIGEGARVLVTRAFAAAGLEFEEDAFHRFREIYGSRLLVHTKPYDGIPETLRALQARGFQQAVLTNKPLEPSRTILEGLKLDEFFARVVGGDGRWGRKPAPDGLLSIIEEAGVAADEALFVGDSQIDLDTSRAAGVRMCLARYGFGARDFAAGDPTGVACSIARAADLIAVIS